MNIYDTALFPFIKGDSLVGDPATLTMTVVKDTKLVAHGGTTEVKPVLHFKETSKGLPLNKTNATELAKHFGGETEHWAGKQIELHSERVAAFGKEHNAVRVRIPTQKPKAAKVKKGRPLPAKTLREGIALKVKKYNGNGSKPPTQENLDFASASLAQACQADEAKRQAVVEFLFDKSLADLDAAECNTLIDWLGAGEDSDYKPNPDSILEIENILKEVDFDSQVEEIEAALDEAGYEPEPGPVKAETQAEEEIPF